MSAADGAAAVIGIQDDRLEGALAEPVRGQARVGEDRPRPVPWLAEIHVHDSAQSPAQDLAEVGCHQRVREVVALPLDDVGSEPWWWFHDQAVREEPDVTYEQAADNRILVRADRLTPVAPDTS
jgi:hypothetical protein